MEIKKIYQHTKRAALHNKKNTFFKTEKRLRAKDNREEEDAAGDSDRMVRFSPGGCGSTPDMHTHTHTHTPQTKRLHI